jgi:hypothetical protein
VKTPVSGSSLFLPCLLFNQKPKFFCRHIPRLLFVVLLVIGGIHPNPGSSNQSSQPSFYTQIPQFLTSQFRPNQPSQPSQPSRPGQPGQPSQSNSSSCICLALVQRIKTANLHLVELVNLLLVSQFLSLVRAVNPLLVSQLLLLVLTLVIIAAQLRLVVLVNPSLVSQLLKPAPLKA